MHMHVFSFGCTCQQGNFNQVAAAGTQGRYNWVR